MRFLDEFASSFLLVMSPRTEAPLFLSLRRMVAGASPTLALLSDMPIKNKRNMKQILISYESLNILNLNTIHYNFSIENHLPPR